jgi:hypothetical protein
MNRYFLQQERIEIDKEERFVINACTHPTYATFSAINGCKNV